MSAYYNEWDADAASWLRELIKRGLIADGDVDERSILEVKPDELQGYTQHHFFAGIGGWSYAARLAGWPDDRPLWTGSPPCQPFSTAGKQRGVHDERHLAPAWLALVAAVRPPFVAGEQVAAAVSKDNWLDDLLDALEAEDYATGAIVLPACSVGAPHIRQRLWFVGRLADTKRQQTHQEQQRPAETKRERSADGFSGRGLDSRLADTENNRPHRSARQDREQDTRSRAQSWANFARSDSDGRLAKSDSARPQQGSAVTKAARHGHSVDAASGADRHGPAHAYAPGWNHPDWLLCRDGKWRPVESGTFPLAHGIPARVGRLRGYGNAIVPQVAAQVIRCLLT